MYVRIKLVFYAYLLFQPKGILKGLLFNSTTLITSILLAFTDLCTYSQHLHHILMTSRWFLTSWKMGMKQLV